MPLQTIEPPRRLYRQIADQLRELILRGEYPDGTRMPPERDLAAQLGVSRPSVREALIALEIEGLVEVRTGSGIYVLPPSNTPEHGHVTADSPVELIGARQSIESELAAQAARQANPAVIATLYDSLALMQREADAGEIPVQGDRMLHLTIATASGNSVLERIVGELFAERGNPLFAQLSHYFESPANWALAIAEHRAVVDAIARGDAEAARAAMHTHLGRSLERLVANWTQAQKHAAVRSAQVNE